MFKKGTPPYGAIAKKYGKLPNKKVDLGLNNIHLHIRFRRLDSSIIKQILNKYKPTLGDFGIMRDGKIQIEYTDKKSSLPKNNEEAKELLMFEFFNLLWDRNGLTKPMKRMRLEEGSYIDIKILSNFIDFVKSGEVDTSLHIDILLPIYHEPNKKSDVSVDESIKYKFLQYLDNLDTSTLKPKKGTTDILPNLF